MNQEKKDKTIKLDIDGISIEAEPTQHEVIHGQLIDARVLDTITERKIGKEIFDLIASIIVEVGSSDPFRGNSICYSFTIKSIIVDKKRYRLKLEQLKMSDLSTTFDTSDLIDAANANSIDPIEVYPEKELKYEDPKFIDGVKYNREEMVYMTGAILAGLLPTEPYVHTNGVPISAIRNAINTARMTIDMLDQVTKPNRFSSESNED